MGQGREEKGKRVIHHTPLEFPLPCESTCTPAGKRGESNPPTADAVGMAGWANTIPNVLSETTWLRAILSLSVWRGGQGQEATTKQGPQSRR